MDNFPMITYSVAGLHFARALLKSAEHSPAGSLYLLGDSVVARRHSDRRGLRRPSFSHCCWPSYSTPPSLSFIVLGWQPESSSTSRQAFVPDFGSGGACIGISTAAVGGLLPLNDFTFRLIEIGMSLEALLLAIILAQHFRLARRQTARRNLRPHRPINRIEQPPRVP